MPKTPRVCSVSECDNPAFCEVLLYDVYVDAEDVFMERDCTCPFLCRQHMSENELSCDGTREPRGDCIYRFTNQGQAQGFSIYNSPVSIRQRCPVCRGNVCKRERIYPNSGQSLSSEKPSASTTHP